MSKNTNTINDYMKAKGAIKVPLRNDMMFHYAMQKSPQALKGLICSLKALDPDTVHKVILTNPIDYGNYGGKEVILDIRVEFNNAEIMDIELQMYHDAYWGQRSLLYLCRAFDSIGPGEKYEDLKPTTFVAILSESLFPDHPEFYSRFLLMNTKYHYPYTTKFALNVLDLTQMDIATEEDKQNGLLDWARMLKANTWEELQVIAEGNPTMEEVVDKMYKVNIIPEERTLFEAHQKYLNAMTSLTEAKERAEAELEHKNAELEHKNVEIEHKNAEIEHKNAEIEHTNEKLDISESENERLRKILEANGIDPDKT